jgi:D-glycero-D-manno-heptose 1,7-bisphosphate phosphatase
LKPCVFFDRDGTLIEERNYLADPGGVVLLPGAAEAVRRAREAGFLAVVLTNQSGVGRGYFTMNEVEAVHRRLRELLAAEGAELDGIYVCPHAPEAGCNCRKPRTGLVQQAARELDVDIPRSWVIGDKAADLELARNAGMRAALVETGYGASATEEQRRLADVAAPGVLAAVGKILESAKAAKERKQVARSDIEG